MTEAENGVYDNAELFKAELEFNAHAERIDSQIARRKRIAGFIGLVVFSTREISYEFIDKLKTPDGRMQMLGSLQDFLSRAGSRRVGEEDRFAHPDAKPFDFDEDY